MLYEVITKLRLSYGILGSDKIEDYQYISQLRNNFV